MVEWSEKKGMKACKVTITTKTDGQENTIVREGEMEATASCVTIAYKEEDALVSMRLQNETAEIERQGDYSLRLRLERGVLHKGELGLGGSCGEIETFAHAIQYSVTETSVLASLRYDLLFGTEKQEISLRFVSRFTK